MVPRDLVSKRENREVNPRGTQQTRWAKFYARRAFQLLGGTCIIAKCTKSLPERPELAAKQLSGRRFTLPLFLPILILVPIRLPTLPFLVLHHFPASPSFDSGCLVTNYWRHRRWKQGINITQIPRSPQLRTMLRITSQSTGVQEETGRRR